MTSAVAGPPPKLAARASSPHLPPGLDTSFLVAAAELGMASASWLFVREVAAEGDDPLVAALRDQVGRSFPVLDAVAARWLEGARRPDVEIAPLLAALRGAERVVFVGVETAWLDAIVPALTGARAALLTEAPFDTDWDRVLSNHAGALTGVDLGSFQAWAGPRSALVTFAYGIHGASTHVVPAWLRAVGPDVRTQFRSLIACDVLRAPMYVYPRWLVEVSIDGFTRTV